MDSDNQKAGSRFSKNLKNMTSVDSDKQANDIADVNSQFWYDELDSFLASLDKDIFQTQENAIEQKASSEVLHEAQIDEIQADEKQTTNESLVQNTLVNNNLAAFITSSMNSVADEDNHQTVIDGNSLEADMEELVYDESELLALMAEIESDQKADSNQKAEQDIGIVGEVLQEQSSVSIDAHSLNDVTTEMPVIFDDNSAINEVSSETLLTDSYNQDYEDDSITEIVANDEAIIITATKDMEQNDSLSNFVFDNDNQTKETFTKIAVPASDESVVTKDIQVDLQGRIDDNNSHYLTSISSHKSQDLTDRTAIARVLKYAEGQSIAVALATTIELIESPSYQVVPTSQSYVKGMLVWQDSWIPLIDLSVLLDLQAIDDKSDTSDSVLTDERTSNYALVLAYQPEPYQALQHFAVALSQMPDSIVVDNSMGCALPEYSSGVLQAISISCVDYHGSIIPIVDTKKLFLIC